MDRGLWHCTGGREQDRPKRIKKKCTKKRFSSKEQTFFNFMAAVTICSDFGAQKIKFVTVSIVSPSMCHEVMGLDAMILVFWMLSFKPTFSLSFFTFIWTSWQPFLNLFFYSFSHLWKEYNGKISSSKGWNYLLYINILAHAMCPVYIVYTRIYNSIMFASFFIHSNPPKKCVASEGLI